jgi:hypothetical protein
MWIDQNGSLLVRHGSRCHNAKTVLLTVGADVDGFLSLYSDDHQAVLEQTSQIATEQLCGKTILSSKGNRYSFKDDLQKNCPLVIVGENFQLGDVFRLETAPQFKNNRFFGTWIGIYVCIQILLELLNCEFDCHVLFCFAAQNRTKEKSVDHIANREKPDEIIFLTPIQTESENPMVLVKDGSFFCDPELLSVLETACDSIERHVCEKACSKAETITKSNHKAKILSLAIPYCKKENEDESVSLKSFQSMLSLLKMFLKAH